MAETRIQLCGRVVAVVDGSRIEQELPGRQGRLLFVYLVANRFRAVPRGELEHAIWPEDAPGRVDSALSALLSKLRRLVPVEGRTQVGVVLPSGAWVDLEAATEGLHRAESAAARRAWTEVWGPARVAQHIAARGFLAGEDAPWVVDVRNRLDGIHLRSLELVAEACLGIGGGELDTAERATRTLVAQAPFRESGHRLLMQVLDARGNRAEALQAYEELRTLLRDELGAAPSPATQDVHRRLLA